VVLVAGFAGRPFGACSAAPTAIVTPTAMATVAAARANHLVG
jgi:hypothetical protein